MPPSLVPPFPSPHPPSLVPPFLGPLLIPPSPSPGSLLVAPLVEGVLAPHSHDPCPLKPPLSAKQEHPNLPLPRHHETPTAAPEASAALLWPPGRHHSTNVIRQNQITSLIQLRKAPRNLASGFHAHGLICFQIQGNRETLNRELFKETGEPRTENF